MPPGSNIRNNELRSLPIIEWHHLNLYKFYPMALACSWTIRGLVYPLNVVKSRLQLQKQNNVYRGMSHAFVDIVRTEGVNALYRGFWITLPQIGASFFYSTIYEKLRNELHMDANIQSPVVVSALAGGCASTSTQFIFVPTDIISQHMMIHNNPKKFSGDSKNAAVVDYLRNDGREGRALGIRVIRAVYHVDGLRGFYRGFFSSLMLFIPQSMIFWGSYYNSLALLKYLQQSFKSPEKQRQAQSWQDSLLLRQAISGALSGICVAIFTNPLEVLRIRIQVQRTNYFETIRRLWHHEGRMVFTKGLAPRMLSISINSCLIMTGYETIKRLSVLPEYKHAILW